MACDVITVGASAVCPPPPSGTRPRFGVINFDDLDPDNPFTEDSNGRITDINLRAGKVMYQFTGFRNDMKKSEEVVDPGVGPFQFKHNAGLIVYERTQVQKKNLEGAVKSRVIIISELKGRDADSYEVVGLRVGLMMNVGEIRNAHANGGFFILSLSTPTGDNEYESRLPQSLGTDYANASDMFDALLSGS